MRAAFHGPASVVGVAVGLLVAATPYVLGLGGPVAWTALLGPAVVGLVLLPVGGRVRQVGAGLVASGLALPAGLAAVLAAGLLVG